MRPTPIRKANRLWSRHPVAKPSAHDDETKSLETRKRESIPQDLRFYVNNENQIITRSSRIPSLAENSTYLWSLFIHKNHRKLNMLLWCRGEGAKFALLTHPHVKFCMTEQPTPAERARTKVVWLAPLIIASTLANHYDENCPNM